MNLIFNARPKISFVFPLIALFWLAINSSQSLMDLMDFFVIIYTCLIAYERGEVRKLMLSYKPYWILIGWLLTILVGYLTGFNSDLSKKLIGFLEFRWMFSFLCYIYLLDLIDWNSQKINVLNSILLSCSVINLIIFFIDQDLHPRAQGLFMNPMSLAHTLGPALLFFLFFNINKIFDKTSSAGVNIFYLIALAAPLILLVLTMTRGVWLGVIFAFLICSIFLGKRYFWKSFLTLSFLIILAVGTSTRLQQRVFAKTSSEIMSNQERLFFWKANLDIFKERPLFGVGYGINNVYLPQYLKKINFNWQFNSHAHNQYLQYLSGTGIAGLFFYFAFLFSIMRFAIKGLIGCFEFKDLIFEKTILLGTFGSLVCFMIGSLTESNFSIAKNRYLFLFLSSVLIVFYRKVLAFDPTSQSD